MRLPRAGLFGALRIKTLVLTHLLAATAIALCCTASLHAQTTRPEPEQKLAHEIYKQFIEIQSGFTTGAKTPVAEAAAARLRTAGFPDSDIFVGGAQH